MPLLDPEVSDKLGTLQLLDDAIAYRLGRLNLPCPGCEPGGRCPKHGRDEELITGYMDRYAAALSDVLADMDPGDVELMMQPGVANPPAVNEVGVALMARLRDLAVTGPVVLELDSGTVLIEQDGPVRTEYPLTTPWSATRRPPARSSSPAAPPAPAPSWTPSRHSPRPPTYGLRQPDCQPRPPQPARSQRPLRVP